ncbi:MAG TPA: hypothetical protein VMY88_09865 [Acidimicrobiales bacterium]|nr:hypothetical protein [Acidimicrobiales bacterium]
MKVLRALLVTVALAGAACTPAGGDVLDAEARAEALSDSAHAPRRFSLQSTRSGEEVTIEGVVEDDYRYSASLSIDGRAVYEETVIDDRRWLRIVGLNELTPATRSTLDALPELAPLVAGQWVADASGAAPEFVEPSAKLRLLGPAPVLDAVRRLDTLENDGTSLAQLRTAREYDPDSVNYLEREDKFDRRADDGLRFDVKPSAYDPDAIFGRGLPPNLEEALERFALYTSYWIGEGRLTRIETFFDVDREVVTKDLAALIEATTPDSGVAAVVPPTVPRPYREVFAIEYPDIAPRITAPEAAVRIRLPEVPEPAAP